MIQRLTKPSNVLLAGYSYLKSSLSGTPGVYGMPLSIGVELTNNCNLKCSECASGSGLMNRQKGFMDISLFDRIITELGPYLYNINLYFQGEPMLHPLFFSFIGNCKGLHTTVSTNGHYLSEENAEKTVLSGLGKLIISLDGMDQETYSAYRVNGRIDKVISGIRNIVTAKRKHKSKLQIEIQCLVNKVNEHQIPELKHFAGMLKVPIRLKSMQILHQEKISGWIPVKKKFSRYDSANGNFVIKNSMPNHCARLWFNPVITWDGKVLPCCFDKDGEYAMGDLNNDSFREIWDGPKYRIFRKSILSGRHMIDICSNCTSGIRGVVC